MTTPAQLKPHPTQHSGKVVLADARAVPPAGLISRLSPPPAPVSPFDPFADGQRTASPARGRALTGTADRSRSTAGSRRYRNAGRGRRLGLDRAGHPSPVPDQHGSSPSGS